MYETISKVMSTTLTNHNEVFLASLTKAMKEALNMTTVQPKGPAYSGYNRGSRLNNVGAINNALSLDGQALGGTSTQHGNIQPGGSILCNS